MCGWWTLTPPYGTKDWCIGNCPSATVRLRIVPLKNKRKVGAESQGVS